MVKLKGFIILIEDDDLMEKYSIVQDNVSTDIKKEFDSKLVYNKKLLKIKITPFYEEATEFQDKEMPMEDSNCICLPVITLDLLLKKKETIIFK